MDIQKSFTYHPPKENQIHRYQEINEIIKDAAIVIGLSCPESAETTIALRKLQEARMWANCSIAVNES